MARVGVLIGGLVIAIVIAWFSQSGKRFLAYARESYEETKRVVWPSRKETVSTTGIVFGFVVIMAIFFSWSTRVLNGSCTTRCFPGAKDMNGN